MVAVRGGRVGRVETEGRRLSGAALLVGALTAGQIGVILPVLAGAAQLSQNVFGDDAEREAVRLIPDSGGEWVLAAAVLLGAAWLLSFAGAVVAFAGFSVSRDGERLRIRRGLFEHREATIPVDRVRAVAVVEGALRLPFGLAALRMEVIGHAKEQAAAQTLFPLLRRVRGARVPRRAAARAGRRRRRSGAVAGAGAAALRAAAGRDRAGPRRRRVAGDPFRRVDRRAGRRLGPRRASARPAGACATAGSRCGT